MDLLALAKHPLPNHYGGRYNYFKGRWRLDAWSDFARYSIYDDIDWDKFDDKGFPDKKDLLTQNGPTNVRRKLFFLYRMLHDFSVFVSLCI